MRPGDEYRGAFKGVCGSKAYLSLQFPGWPYPGFPILSWQRIMIFGFSEAEAQKASAPGGQVNVALPGLLLLISTQVSQL